MISIVAGFDTAGAVEFEDDAVDEKRIADG